MPRAFYVAGIEYAVVSVPIDAKVGVLSFTNDHSKVASLLSAGFRRQVGEFEIKFLTSDATLVAYWLEDREEPRTTDELYQSLLGWLVHVRRFFLALWLVKDNAAGMELGYLESPHQGTPAYIWRNFWQGVISMADGGRGPIQFSAEEFRKACELLAKIMGLLESEVRAGRPSASRWNTALYFLDAARITLNPGVKVAHYCTCLEALFATDTQELSHKLAERVACFLEKTASGRRALFAEIKAAYTLRSKIVHGVKDAIVKGLDAKAVAIQCDAVLRRVLHRTLEEPDLFRRFIEGHDKDSDEYFLSLVLGSAT